MQIDNLQRYYDNVTQSTTDPAFFLCLSDYVNCIYEDKQLNDLLEKHFVAAANGYLGQLNAIGKQVVSESITCHNELVILIEKHKVHDQPVLQALSRLQAFLAKEEIEVESMQRYEFRAQSIYRLVGLIIQTIHTTKHKQLVEQYFGKDFMGNTVWTFSPAFVEYQKFLDKIKSQEKVTIVGSWNQLYIAHITIIQDDEATAEMIKRGHWAVIKGRIALKKEVTDLLEGKTNRKPVVFDRKKYEIYLLRFHANFTQKIREVQDSPIESQPVTDQPSEAHNQSNEEQIIGESQKIVPVEFYNGEVRQGLKFHVFKSSNQNKLLSTLWGRRQSKDHKGDSFKKGMTIQLSGLTPSFDFKENQEAKVKNVIDGFNKAMRQKNINAHIEIRNNKRVILVVEG